ALVTGAAPAFATEHTETFRMPVEVKGYQVKQEYNFDIARPHVDAHITRMSTDVVDANGDSVPIKRLMLHHIVFSAYTGRTNAACPAFTSWDSKTTLPGVIEHLYGAGEEHNQLVLPPGYGVKMDKDKPWLMTWMLMNHRRTADHAFIQWKVTYDDSPAITDVHPYWLDIENCKADPVFDVPGGGKRGSTYKRTYDLTMPESGRIVAGGGHVHGGARNLELSEPDCGNRRLDTLKPAWGLPSHPFYNVRPVLHEPGPIAVSGFLSAQGFPIAKGQRIRLTANYDNSRLHTRVMGISMIYVAPQDVQGCGPMPTDVQEYQTSLPHRTSPPLFRVPLTGLDSTGRAVTIQAPPGRRRDLGHGGVVAVRDFSFSKPNVVVDAGAVVRWTFAPWTIHNVTVADGPRGFSSPNGNLGAGYAKRLTKPGTYKVFCALHPVEMTGTIKVRRPGR
ncbi:MAG: hypothetical protein QOE08_599, partial [Thermoleophilaceae bacterium]|nr:hypothetical protein [Thermoleophilaceae bacterium]